MNTANEHSQKIGFLERDFVLKAAEVRLVKVKSIKIKPNENVYCLATKKNGNFIADGIVVKNCDALRYGIFSHFFDKSLNTMSPEDLDRMFRDAMEGNDLPDVFQQPRY